MLKKGLNDQQVRQSREKYGNNVIPDSEPTTFWAEFKETFSDPMIKILLFIAGLMVVMFFLGYAEIYEPIGTVVAVLIVAFVTAKTGVASDTKYRELKNSTKKDVCKVYRNSMVTVIEVEPNVVTQIKTVENDGYEAIQLGTDTIREKLSNKPEMGHTKKANTEPKRFLKEIRGVNVNEYTLGQVIGADIFEEGEIVDVTGTSKGKGFQGVVKRHGFGGVGQTTHGQHNRLRAPGSIGACSYPARVFKGTRMAGQMGNHRVTVQNLQVLKVIPEHNLLLIKGSVPGSKGSIVIIEK